MVRSNVFIFLILCLYKLCNSIGEVCICTNDVINCTNGRFKTIKCDNSVKNEVNFTNNSLKNFNMFDFFNLSQVTTFKFDINLISDANFPDTFSNAKMFSLSQNKLKHIKKNSFRNFQKLKNLQLHSNEILLIDDGAFANTNLTSLYLNNNNIKDLNFLKNLTKLEMLDLSCNKIQNLSEFHSYNLVNLIILKLAFNDLNSLPSGFLEYLPNLKNLDLAHNVIIDVYPLGKNDKIQKIIFDDNNIYEVESLKNGMMKEVEVSFLNNTLLCTFVEDLFRNHNVEKLRMQRTDSGVKVYGTACTEKIPTNEDNNMYKLLVLMAIIITLFLMVIFSILCKKHKIKCENEEPPERVSVGKEFEKTEDSALVKGYSRKIVNRELPPLPDYDKYGYLKPKEPTYEEIKDRRT